VVDERSLPELGSKFKVNTTRGELEFEHFQPKNSNTVKLRLTLPRSDGAENIWMAVSDQDMEAYSKEVRDGEETIRLGVLRNQSLAGLPWGAYVPYRLVGDGRPESCIEVFSDADPATPVILNQRDSQ
jgi:hypothetical protein